MRYGSPRVLCIKNATTTPAGMSRGFGSHGRRKCLQEGTVEAEDEDTPLSTIHRHGLLESHEATLARILIGLVLVLSIGLPRRGGAQESPLLGQWALSPDESDDVGRAIRGWRDAELRLEARTPGGGILEERYALDSDTGSLEVEVRWCHAMAPCGAICGERI